MTVGSGPRKRLAQKPDDMVISQRDAQRLVGEPEIEAAFVLIMDGYRAAWEKTTPDEGAKRELAYTHFKAVADVWAALKRRADSARVRDLKAANPNG